MTDETDSRKPALDDEVDGLDCFATEGVDIVDSADDVGALVKATPALPAVREPALPVVRAAKAVWRDWARDQWIRRSFAASALLGVGVLSLWLIEPDRPKSIVADTPAPAPSVAAAPPVVQPVPPPPVAIVVVPSPTTATSAAAPRTIAPPVTAPVRRPPASLNAPSPSTAASSEAVARPAVPSAPPVPSPEERVVVAPPEVVRSEPPAAAPAAPPVAAVVVPTDRASIERVLQAYRDAYDRLDAPAAAVIWPRVDTRALNRAFGTLSEQDVSFERCDLAIIGAKANAKCTGEIRYVRRVGDQTPRTRRLSWVFAFERVSDRWQIAQVIAE
jgi:hypothetical protein